MAWLSDSDRAQLWRELKAAAALAKQAEDDLAGAIGDLDKEDWDELRDDAVDTYDRVVELWRQFPECEDDRFSDVPTASELLASMERTDRVLGQAAYAKRLCNEIRRMQRGEFPAQKMHRERLAGK